VKDSEVPGSLSAIALCVVVLSCFMLRVRATDGGTLKDPIQDYLHLGDHDQAVELPEVKGISVLELDVNSDGRREIFIRLAATAVGSGIFGQCTFPARMDSNGSLRRVNGMFRRDMFYVGEVETPDGGKIRGLLVYYPGKGGGDLAIYQLANDYMVRTSLGSLKLEDKGDRAFWDKYFAGPSEDQPYRSVIEYPVKHQTTKELAEGGYDLSAVHQLNGIRENNPKSAKRPATKLTPAAVFSPAGPTESSPRSPEPMASPRTLQNDVKKGFWIVIVIVILSAGTILYLKKRRSIKG